MRAMASVQSAEIAVAPEDIGRVVDVDTEATQDVRFVAL